jgi:ParB-like chromosome segregation protein Spo0J
MLRDHMRHHSHDLQSHSIAYAFPMLAGTEFAELVADIKAHGVREPIVLHEAKILDGRNRYRAAQAAGVECPSTEYQGKRGATQRRAIENPAKPPPSQRGNDASRDR